MKHLIPQPPIADLTSNGPFAVWLGRTLKTCHEDAVNEPIPFELLELLPPPTKEH